VPTLGGIRQGEVPIRDQARDQPNVGPGNVIGSLRAEINLFFGGITKMIMIGKFSVDASLRRVSCAVCLGTCWGLIERECSTFQCVQADCSNKTILFLAPDFFSKIAANRTTGTPKDSSDKPIRARLSKRFFLSLPKGVFIMSNIFDAPGQPTCAESVSPACEREKQWEKIVSLKCNRRLCTVFKNEREAMAYLSSIYKRLSKGN